MKPQGALSVVALLALWVAWGCGPGPRPPLHAAAYRGDAREVVRLIKAGADFEAMDGSGDTPLLSAVFSGDLETMRALLDAGADVLGLTYGGRGTGMRALDFAVKRRDYAAAKLLLSRGAAEGCREPGTLSVDYPAMQYAIATEDRRMIRILIDGGCQSGARNAFGHRMDPPRKLTK